MTSRKSARLGRAIQRMEKAAELTPKQKLARLDERLGKGIGAAKERAKLQKQMEKVS